MAIPFFVRAFAAALTFCAIAQSSAWAQTKEIERSGGPYVPTPQVVVDQMLRFGRVGASDFVMDLGSGDGVIVLTAVQQMKASGVGIEIDPELVKLATTVVGRVPTHRNTPRSEGCVRSTTELVSLALCRGHNLERGHERSRVSGNGRLRQTAF